MSKFLKDLYDAEVNRLMYGDPDSDKVRIVCRTCKGETETECELCHGEGSREIGDEEGDRRRLAESPSYAVVSCPKLQTCQVCEGLGYEDIYSSEWEGENFVSRIESIWEVA